ncbi:hypothetical protein [Acidithiobacillus ferrooxidans]|uniref:hypothetical protein n=1 Tax=Acidithiobacillus ferrooxidans TaxID=920 RepID=UPI0019403BB7|nr:hypothetical protein [Acidithiobacillus ferrooxidans]
MTVLLEQSAITAAALAVGNFIYAMIESKNYGKAVERSYFQAVAIALLYCSIRFGF